MGEVAGLRQKKRHGKGAHGVCLVTSEYQLLNSGL